MSKALRFLVGMGQGYMNASAAQEKAKKEQEVQDLRNQLTRMQIDGAQIDLDNKKALATAGEDRTAALNEPVDGMGPSAMVVGKNGMAGAQSFAPEDTQGAQSYAASQNTPEAKQGRTVSALAKMDPVKAIDYKAKAVELARQAEGEGMMDFVRYNFADAPSVEDIDAGKVKVSPVVGLEDFNKVGKWKVPEGAQRQWFNQDLGNGRKVQDFRIIGPDGKPIAGGFSGRAVEGLFGMTAKEREAMADGRAKDAAAGRREDRRLSLAESETESQNEYRAGMVRNGATKLEGAQDLKMPEAVKLQIDGLDNEIKALDGVLSPTPADKARRIDLTNKRNAVLSQYMPGSGGAQQPDPLGWRGQSTPAGAPAAAPGDARQPMDESTALSILQNEYGGNPAMAASDVQSIQAELAKKGLTAENRMVLQDRLRVAMAAASVKRAQPTKPRIAPMQAPQQGGAQGSW